ncbi:MAG: hypothetical protein ABSA45_06645 [Verrucomicrobiota bacterium]|jgi:hypothetical protein
MSGVVHFQTRLQIFCKAGLEMFRIVFALKNVNVKEFHSFSAGLPSRGSERLSEDRFSPPSRFALWRGSFRSPLRFNSSWFTEP